MINKRKSLLWLLIIFKLTTPTYIIPSEQDEPPQRKNHALPIAIASLVGGGAIGAIAMHFYNAPESNTPPDLTALQKKLQKKENQNKQLNAQLQTETQKNTQKDQLITQKIREINQKDQILNRKIQESNGLKKTFQAFQENDQKKQMKIHQLEETINILKEENTNKLNNKVIELTKKNGELQNKLQKLNTQYAQLFAKKERSDERLDMNVKDNTKLNKKNTILQNQLNRLREEYAKIVSEKSSVVDQLKEKIQQINTLIQVQKEVEKYERKLKQQNQQNQHLLTANRRLAQKLEKKGVNLKDINSDNDKDDEKSDYNEPNSGYVNSNNISSLYSGGSFISMSEKVRNLQKNSTIFLKKNTYQTSLKGYLIPGDSNQYRSGATGSCTVFGLEATLALQYGYEVNKQLVNYLIDISSNYKSSLHTGLDDFFQDPGVPRYKNNLEIFYPVMELIDNRTRDNMESDFKKLYENEKARFVSITAPPESIFVYFKSKERIILLDSHTRKNIVSSHFIIFINFQNFFAYVKKLLTPVKDHNAPEGFRGGDMINYNQITYQCLQLKKNVNPQALFLQNSVKQGCKELKYLETQKLAKMRNN